MASLLLEVCVASVEDAVAAVAGGADRLEVNAALALGGLTPSLGMFEAVRRAAGVPLIAMVRPRPGGFVYSDDETAVMLRDARLLLDAGADGIAFGFLTTTGDIDVERCRAMVDVIGTGEAVFHRAMDVCRDPVAALDELIRLGVRRVMTSGQETRAIDGAGVIRRLIDHSGGRIGVLPAGGINASNVGDLIRWTGCEEVHASLRSSRVVGPAPRVQFSKANNAGDEMHESTDTMRVAELSALLGQPVER